MNETHSRLTRSAGTLGIWTSLSRVLGFVRDSASANLFGANIVSDAYLIAFRIPNLLRDLLAEGALSSAFIPAMSKEQELHGDAAAWRLAGQMFNALALIFVGVTALGMLLAPQVVGVIAPGFSSRPEQLLLTIHLTRILMPFLAFMSLGALFMGANNVFGNFTPGAMASSFLNLTLIGFWLGLRRWGSALSPEATVTWWAVGALCGGFLQMAVQLPAALKGGLRLRWLGLPFRDSKLRKVFWQMVPALLANSTFQVNLLINSLLASFLAAGSITHIYYGSRLFQLPLGIFGVSVATAALPNLSSLHARKDVQAFKKTLGHALRLTLFITLPAAIGMVLLSGPINILLFRSGHFSLQDAQETAQISVCYSVGIIFASWVKVLVPSLYAREEGPIAAKVSAAIIALDLAMNLSLMGSFGAKSFALTTSACNLVQASVLLWLLRRRLGPLLRDEVLADFRKMGLAALAMALAVLALQWLLDAGLDAEALAVKSRLAWEVPMLMGLAMGVYFGAARLLGLNYLGPLLGKGRKLV